MNLDAIKQLMFWRTKDGAPRAAMTTARRAAAQAKQDLDTVRKALEQWKGEAYEVKPLTFLTKASAPQN